MKLVKKKLANVRVSRTDKAIVRTTPTEGTIHLNDNAVEVLNVKYEDVLSVEGRRAEIGVIAYKDEAEKEPIFGLFLLPTGASDGCKLAQPSGKKSGTLQFNSATIWKEMGGNSEANEIFYISADNNAVTEDEDGEFVSYADAIESGFLTEDGAYAESDEDAGEVAGEAATICYILEFVASKPKPVRVKKTDTVDEGEDDSDDDDMDEDED